MKVKLILPALAEARSPGYRPIKYSLFLPLGLATLAAHLEPDDQRIWQAAGTVSSILSPGLVELAAEVGLRSLFVGFETLSRDNLELCDKPQDERVGYAEAIRKLHGLGVMVNASFVFGRDHDDESVFDRTVDFAVERGIETATFHILTPYPGTRLFERLERGNVWRGDLRPTKRKARLLGMRTNFPAAIVIGLVAFVMNPGFACSASEDDLPNWQYGEAEMTRAVQGTWRLTIERSGGESAVTFALAPGAGPGSALTSAPSLSLACSSRNFVRPAGACLDLSTLQLSGQVLAAEPSFGTPAVSGEYVVTGTTYRGGELNVGLGSTLRFYAVLDASDQVTSCSAFENLAGVPSRLERVE